jgi:hypothetical protein
MALATVAPLPQYFDLDGDPLDGGRLYFGAANQNPLTNPATVYWDAAATIPAAQPVRTVNGYTARNGTPALLYATADYSVLVQDRRGRNVVYAANSADFSNSSNVLSQLLAFIANLASSIGASLVGFIQAGAGAVLRTLLAKQRETSVSITDYSGADVTGATNSDIALDAALTYLSSVGGGVLDLPAGTFKLGASFAVPENVTLRGRGKNVTVLKRDFAGVLITQMGKRSGLEYLQLDGNAGASVIVTLTGGINFDYQWMQHCRIWNTSASCVTFAHETGAEFRAIACDFYTSGTPGVVACIATLSAGENAAIPRHFMNCAGAGSTLYDFSGANDTFVFGGYSDGFITSATTSKLMMSNMRVATTYSPQTIAGVNLCIRDCVFALAPTLTCTDSIFECITPGWVVTDNGSGNSVLQRLVPYTPAWTASTADPAIGNGSITGYYSRQGSDITVQIDLRFGTTTTFGTGNWRISVPRQDLTPYTVVQVVGSGFTQGAGANNFVVIPRINAGAGYIELFAVNTAGALIQLGSATQAWNTAGNIRLSFTYRTN